MVLQMGLIGLLIQLAVYAMVWFRVYYPMISMPRYTAEGYYLGVGLRLYFRGHILVLAVYFVLLFFFTRTYGGSESGYRKPLAVLLSHIIALVIVNTLTYFQLSLMRNWLIVVQPMLWCTLLQIIVSFLWSLLEDRLYLAVFPVRRLTLVSGVADVTDILGKFEARDDRYLIEKTMFLSDGEDKVVEALSQIRDGIVLWELPTKVRNRLLKRCYADNIRVYLMPKIPDVLVRGAEPLHLFDTPLFVVREYAMRFEQRFVKRTIDIVLSLILIVVTSPLMLVTAIAIKCHDKGPVLYRQTRCTLHRREFEILKFRSMSVDAERDGVARLAAVHDVRITPVGRVIRPCRIDELPQLFNILKGEMSFIGPRPERPEIIDRYLQEMPEFAYRLRVKAGLAGYAQIYGKYNTTPYDKLKLDLAYIENYSVFLDLRLMLLTIRILFTPDAAEGVASDQITAMKDTQDGSGDS